MIRNLERGFWGLVLIIFFAVFCSVRVYAKEAVDLRTKAANSIYFYEECGVRMANGSASAGSIFNPNGDFNENATKIMTGLLNAGYSQAETAGVIGSLKGESGAFNPGEGENKYMGDISENDMSFRVTDSACYSRCGFGIAQWTSQNRQEGLQDYADSKNMSVASLSLQIEYLIVELKSPSYNFAPGSSNFDTNGENNAEAAGRAATAVCERYEIPGTTAEEVRYKCNNDVRNSVAFGKAAFEFMENNRKGGGSSSSVNSSDNSDEESDDEDASTASNNNNDSNVMNEGQNVTVIGDSITVRSEAAGSFDKKLKNADIYKPQVGKHMVIDDASGGDSGKTLIEELIKSNTLRDIVVVALGTNDGLTKNDVQGVVDTINGDGQHTIVFVTNYGVSEHDYTSNNNVFKEIKANNSNVVLANWAGVVGADPSKYMDDDVHPKEGVGTDLFVNTIYEALTNGITESQERQYNEVCPPKELNSSGDTDENGVTFADYNGNTIAFPIAEATKDNISGGRGQYTFLSNIPCNNSAGCHYGPSADAAFDICYNSTKCSKETPVVSITDGTVTRDIQTIRNGAQCDHVRIKSDIDNTVIAYMHLLYEPDLPWHAGDKVKAGDLIGHVSDVGPCHDNSTPHVHIDKGSDTSATGGPSGPSDRDPELVKMINAAYDNLPENEAELAAKKSGNNIGDTGLTYEQAKTFMKHYGANLSDSSSDAAGSALWGMCNGGGSNCVTFSAFFYNKFTSNNRKTFGNGFEVVNNLKNDNNVTIGTRAKVWSIFSWSNGGYGHTGVILGHHDGKWIVGHASCSNTGIGEGTGLKNGGGSGYVVEDKDVTSAVGGKGATGLKYAYLSKIINTNAISRYLKNGK